MTVKIPGIPLLIGGQSFVVPPLPLGFLEVHGDQLSGNFEKLDSATVKLVIDAAHTALRRNYPDVTRDFLTENIDVGNFSEVMQSLMDVSGLKRRELESAQVGELQAS